MDCTASCLSSEINSAGGYSRKSKGFGNRVVIKAEVYHQSEPQSVNHCQNCHHSDSNHEKAYRQLEEIELLHYAKMPTKNDNAVVIVESKVCVVII